MPRTRAILALRAARKYFSHTSGSTSTFPSPVSSSKPRKRTPRAVPGFCRWVTAPAVHTRRPFSYCASSLRDKMSRCCKYRRISRTGCPVALIPVVAISAAANSKSVIPGKAGATISLIPGSMPGRSLAAIPAAQIAWRRSRPNDSSAPLLAKDSIAVTLTPVRREISATEVNGPSLSRARTIFCAVRSLTSLTLAKPSRRLPGDSSSGVSRASAWTSEALISTGKMVTPCRAASAINDWGE